MSSRNRYGAGDGRQRTMTRQRRELSINTSSSSRSLASSSSIYSYGDDKDASSPIWTRPSRSSAASRSSSILKRTLYITLGIPLVLYSWLILFNDRLGEAYLSPDLRRAERILWLVAHPDDESMFFAPSILNLLSEHEAPNGTDITPIGHVLSLSSGNAEGLGKERTRELRASCWMLGISSEHCIALDVDNLPDDMSAWWQESVIEYWTRTYVEKWRIDTIISFDEAGVSGHANHRAINAALVKASNLDLQFPNVFTLRSSSSPLTKYTSVFSFALLRTAHKWRLWHPLPEITWDPDVHPIAAQKHPFLTQHPSFTKDQLRKPYSHLFSSHPSLLVNSPWQYLRSRGAFKQHASQNVWFRKIYMLTSRYMWFNELQKVVRIHERIVDMGKIREAQRQQQQQ